MAGGTREAAACGPRSRGEGALLRRRTNPAMRPFGAAAVGGGVDRLWPRARLGGPMPRAEAGGMAAAVRLVGVALVTDAGAKGIWARVGGSIPVEKQKTDGAAAVVIGIDGRLSTMVRRDFRHRLREIRK